MNKYVLVKFFFLEFGDRGAIPFPFLYRGTIDDAKQEIEEAIENCTSFCGIDLLGTFSYEVWTLEEWFEKYCTNK